MQTGLVWRVRNRLSLERDLWSWRAQLAGLRVAARPFATRRALFCNLLNMPATAKVESLIAGLLRLKGYAALILLERPNPPIERIFRAAVPDAQFVYLDTGLDAEQRAAVEGAADAIMARVF